MSVMPRRSLRTLLRFTLLTTAFPAIAIAQPAGTATFISTLGKDTIAFEQYARSGNVIKGTWVIAQQLGVFVHDYATTLHPDGTPARYELRVTRLGMSGAPEAADAGSWTIDYGPDTTTYVTAADSVVTRKVAMRNAYPLLGESLVGLELALARLQSTHIDSSIITLHSPTGPSYAPVAVPVKFIDHDSVRVAGATVRLDREGRVLDFTQGPLETRRVPTLDVATLTAHFVALHPARPVTVRTAIALPATTLQRFVGTYRIGQFTFNVVTTADGLDLHLGDQPPVHLLAEAPSKFFVKGQDLQVEFESDAAGTISGFALIQNGVTQHVIKAP